MEINTVKLLDYNDWRILKTIRLEKQYGSRYMWAELVYLRNVSKDYCFNVDNKTTHGGIVYDIEKSYPNDVFDDIILNAIRTEYPNAELRSRELVTDMDIERLRRIYGGKIKEKAIVYLTPEVLNSEYKPWDTTFIQFRIPIDICIPSKEIQAFFCNEGYFASYDYAKASELQLILEKVKPSLHGLSEVL